MSPWAVVAAGGSGRRLGGEVPKQFLPLAGKPLLAWAVGGLAAWSDMKGVVVVAPEGQVETTRDLLESAGVPKLLRVVPGGAERQDSVGRGLDALDEAGVDDLVFVHDGARPFPPTERFGVLAAAARPDGALLAVPCADTLKRERGGASAATVDRSGLWQAQTPQVFPLGLLREALARAREQGSRGTDEASLVESLGRCPRLVAGDPRNIKVTTRPDLLLAEGLAGCVRGPEAARPVAVQLAVGHGYDVHRLVEGRRLVLGGVPIPHEKGLLGHSDADVLAHAVADACLGAAGLGDIGRHFPDSDPAWAGASSLDLLARIRAMIVARGLRVARVDATLIAERPKIAPHVPAMESGLSAALGLGPGGVTVKATTTEGLGFEGRREGMSAHAVALLERLEAPAQGPLFG